jgi:peptidoglycan hydrolase-like protein with peptidoglycan-binding domain
MKSLTTTGKLALGALLAATIGIGDVAWAGARGDSSWWLRKKEKQSTSLSSGVSSVTNFAGSKGGKAVTKTEIFAGKSILPMVSPSSDQAMAEAVARYEIIVARGGWPQVSGSKLARAGSGRDVIKLRQRLVAEGYLPPDSPAGESAEKYSDAVMKAVARFQANYGLAVTGKVDKATAAAMNVSAAQRLATLRANVPRMQEYAKDLGARYIIVNVPALQLEAVNFNSVFSRHNIIAGQPSRPTPVTLTRISDINFNPYWNAPVSIVEKDIIPRVQNEGTRVLRDMSMRIYDGYNGPEVDPDTVDWDNVPADRFFFRQDPGEENAMAGVKINFPSPFGIYLHDTPTRNLFTTGARYLSSGCIRVDQVQVLVNWILNGQDGWNPSRIEQTTASRERIDVKVTDGPQLRTVYLTAWATASGQVNFREDIYDLDGAGFVVGQPLEPGEYSDDGRRFVLKPLARQASVTPDGVDYFKPKRKTGGFDLFSTSRSSRTSLSSRASRERSTEPVRLLGRRDEPAVVTTNFLGQPEPNKKKLLGTLKTKKGKEQADSDKKKKKTQKATASASTKKKPVKASSASSGKSKASEKTAEANARTKKQTEPVAESPPATKKKKKKIVEASATAAAANPVAPVKPPLFVQQQ